MAKINEVSSDIYRPFSDKFLFTDRSIQHPVYVEGEGPSVILLHELPGITQEFWRLAYRLRDAGFTIYIPDMYTTSLEDVFKPSLTVALKKICISREIKLLSRNDSSPITLWLRALARSLPSQNSPKGIGVVGLCMTGNFALSMVMEPIVTAPIASEPALPLDMVTKKGKSALHLSQTEETTLQKRADVNVMALRFKGDPSCTKHRFDALESLIGEERFCRIELDDHHKNPNGNPFPHAVLTKDFIDQEGSATHTALKHVVEFLQTKLC